MQNSKQVEKVKYNWINLNRLDWRDGVRSGTIFFGIGLFFLCLDLEDPQFLSTPLHWSISIGFCLGGWLIFQLARMLARWNCLKTSLELNPIHRNKKDWRELRRGYRELFGYLAISLSAIAVLIFLLRTENLPLWPEMQLVASESNSARSIQSWLFLLVMVSSFFPTFLGNFLRARFETKGTRHGMFRSDAVSPMTAYLGGATLLSIVLLAIWAGNQDSEISSTLAFYVTFGVMLMFIAFILWPQIARLLNTIFERRELEKDTIANAGVPTSLPAATLSYCDSFLVRLIAPMSGATQRGPLVPHFFVLSVLLPLILIGFFLPSPFGLVSVFFGMLLVLSLGRRWAWIENDRETASRLLQTKNEEIHIGFENDLKDEALLGYATLFLFVPLALYQIHGWLPGVFVPGEGYANDPVRDWVGFFGSELAKAVPFVDWWEIYQIDIDRPYQPAAELPLGKHLTFFARALVDLVIMAALFQALGIWQRGRTQRRLYDSGQLDAFDPFTEHEFFTRGMLKTRSGYRPRERFEERIEEHLEARTNLGLPPTPYNERRLSEIIKLGSGDPKQIEVVAGAEWMISTFNVLAGTPKQKVSQLLEQWNRTIQQPTGPPISFAGAQFVGWRREEKLRLEALLTEVLDAQYEVIPKTLESRDIKRLTKLADYCGNAVEFQFSRLLIIEILGQCTDRTAFWALAAQVGSAAFYDKQPDFSEHMERCLCFDPSKQFGPFHRPRLSHQDMRALVIDAIEEHAKVFECEDQHLLTILSFLEAVSEVEANKPADKARIATSNIKSRCGMY